MPELGIFRLRLRLRRRLFVRGALDGPSRLELFRSLGRLSTSNETALWLRLNALAAAFWEAKPRHAVSPTRRISTMTTLSSSESESESESESDSDSDPPTASRASYLSRMCCGIRTPGVSLMRLPI